MEPKFIFASDIDNTLTGYDYFIPPEVVEYLTSLHVNGYEIVFLTGRCLSFALLSTKAFDIPYYICVQNGAEVIHMPENTPVIQYFLQRDILYDLDLISRDHKDDFFVFSGFESGDFCYYRPDRFSSEILKYFEIAKRFSDGKWLPIKELSEIQDEFPLVKFIGDRKEMEIIKEKIIKKRNDLNVILMGDTTDPAQTILLITHKSADKGKVLEVLCKNNKWKSPVIAAGDSYNDICLLKNANISITMEDAPDELKKMAHIIAKPSTQHGIIAALQEAAVRLCK